MMYPWYDEKHQEYEYLNAMGHILKYGVDKPNRTGIAARTVFGYQMRFNLRNEFPLLTTRKMYWKGIAEELLWFVAGDTNSKHLEEKKVNIWKGNTSREFLDSRGLDHPEGYIGPGYGFQWRNWNGEYDVDGGHGKGIDQLQNAIDMIKNDPGNRRIIVSAWNPEQIDQMALPPCHIMFQFAVLDGELYCQMYQRSCDFFLGVAFNIASYALLTCMVAKVCGLKPAEFVWTGGDVHIYSNHFEQAAEQLARKPKPLPKLVIHKDTDNIDDFKFEDFELVGYESHPAIKADMAV